MCGGATKGMSYHSHWGSNLQTVQCEGGRVHWRTSFDKAVTCAIPTAATVDHSQRLHCKLKYCGRLQPQLSGIITCCILSVKSSSSERPFQYKSIQWNKEGGGSKEKWEQRDKETELRRREAKKYSWADRNGTGNEKALNLQLRFG